MKTYLKTIAIAATLVGAGVPALAQSQLIANAGLTPAEAQGLTLNEIAAAKFSRDTDSDDRQSVLSRGDVTVISRSAGNDAGSQLAANAGLTPEEARGLTLNEIAAVKFSRDTDSDDRQSVVRHGDVTVISRSAGNAAWSQLAANAGLTPDEARGLSLSEIAAVKFSRDTDSDD